MFVFNNPFAKDLFPELVEKGLEQAGNQKIFN